MPRTPPSGVTGRADRPTPSAGASHRSPGTLLEDFDADGADYGAMGWHDPASTAALTDLTGGGIDDAGATAARQQVAQVLQAELPVIPIAWYQQTAAFSKKLGNVRLDPFERDFGLARMRWAQ